MMKTKQERDDFHRKHKAQMEAYDKEAVENPWLSPIKKEREWQEKHLKKIFGHYPNASPAWQYMNGLIMMCCEHLNINVEYEPIQSPPKNNEHE